MLELALTVLTPGGRLVVRASGLGRLGHHRLGACAHDRADEARVAAEAHLQHVRDAGRVGERLGLTVANMRFIKPLDELLILQLADRHRLLVTIEENAIAGGAGSAVSELLAAHGVNVHCLHLGLPDSCQEQAEHGEQLAACGLDAAGIEASVRAEMVDLGMEPEWGRLSSVRAV